MKLSKISSKIILDADKEDEVIYICETTSNGVYYTKTKYLNKDFNGREIESEDDFIRTKSIWYANIKDNNLKEVLPSGKFDINAIFLSQNYIYVLLISDKDGDGNLANDYENGEIWRIHKEALTTEFCIGIGEFNFHGFEVASDRYVIFKSEDRVPDETELVIVDLQNNKMSIITNQYGSDDWFDYRIITDTIGNPIYLLSKKWVSEGEKGSIENELRCDGWDDLVNQLDWTDF